MGLLFIGPSMTYSLLRMRCKYNSTGIISWLL